MALRKKINKEDYDALDATKQALYVVDPKNADVFTLDLEGDDDGAAAKRAKDAEKKRADKLAAEKAELQAEYDAKLAELEGKDAENADLKKKAKTSDSVAKQLKDLQEARAADKAKAQAKEARRVKQIEAGNLAKTLVGADKTGLIMPHLENRLAVVFDPDDEDAEPTVQVLDAKGKPTTMTVDDLVKEIRQDKTFSSILIGSKAGGGRAPPPSAPPTGGRAPVGPNPANPGPASTLAQLSRPQLVDHMREVVAANRQG